MAGVISTIGIIAAATSIAATVATTAMSFAEKKKAETRKREADAVAERKMEEARKKLNVNYADELSIAKEPYQREREAMLVQGANIMDAAVESERGGGASAGRLLAAQQEGQGQIRDAQSVDLFNLEAAQAEEDSRLRDVNVGMDLNQIAGAQAAAAEAQDAANVAKQQAIQGIGSVAQQAMSFAPLYAKSSGTRAFNKATRQANRADTTLDTRIQESFNPLVAQRNFNAQDVLSGKQKFGDVQTTTSGTGLSPFMGEVTQLEWNAMSPQEQKDYLIQNPEISKSFFNN